MPVKVVSRRQVLRGKVITVEQQQLELAGGRPFLLDLVVHPGAAAALALDARGVVHMVRQYRYAAGQELLEIAAGMRDGDETPVACAHRELQEEVGVTASEMISLGEIWVSPGYSTERIGLFLAQQLGPGRQHLDADESLHVVQVPLAEAVRWAQDGTLTDVKTVVALLRTAAFLGPDHPFLASLATRQPAAPQPPPPTKEPP